MEFLSRRLTAEVPSGKPLAQTVVTFDLGGRGKPSGVAVVSNSGALADSSVAGVILASQWTPGDSRGRPATFACRVAVSYEGSGTL